MDLIPLSSRRLQREKTEGRGPDCCLLGSPPPRTRPSAPAPILHLEWIGWPRQRKGAAVFEAPYLRFLWLKGAHKSGYYLETDSSRLTQLGWTNRP